MKCKYCGADLTIDDEVCPFCHNPNPYYVKHREDMHRYEQDYQETKSDVYETAGKTSRKATRIAILAVLGGLFLGTVVLNTNIWTVERMIQRHKIRNNISTHLTKLDQYLAEEEWASFTDYIDMISCIIPALMSWKITGISDSWQTIIITFMNPVCIWWIMKIWMKMNIITIHRIIPWNRLQTA